MKILKILLSIWVKAKVDFDRSRTYVGYVRFLMMIYVTLKVSDDTRWGAWAFDNPWAIFLFMALMLWSMRRIGKLITKHITPKEAIEINKANPQFMEMYNKIMKL